VALGIWDLVHRGMYLVLELSFLRLSVDTGTASSLGPRALRHSLHVQAENI
jgi:hypothetical protein